MSGTAADGDAAAPAGNRLRSYLAEHDVPCVGCGYNLRGVTIAQCPECGHVIPAPPPPAPGNELAMRCHRCGCALLGLPTASCPECGATDITLADARARAARHEPDLRRVPRTLQVCVAMGVVVAIFKIVVIWATARPVVTVNPALLALSVPVALTPALLAWTFRAEWGLAGTSTPENIAARRAAVNVLGVLLVAIAIGFT